MNSDCVVCLRFIRFRRSSFIGVVAVAGARSISKPEGSRIRVGLSNTVGIFRVSPNSLKFSPIEGSREFERAIWRADVPYT